MSQYEKEINRRRTFAIISHPDAGKTTLTEKFLLYGGAIAQAGQVKGKKNTRAATSDWMEIEKQRGISVTSSVMQFQYEGYCINILDTPGHQDFSEDTYRTLMAADSAVMVIDAAKGVEAQTLANTYMALEHDLELVPILNKIDLPSAHPDEVAQEVEDVIGLPCMDAPRVSAKTGLNVDQVLERVVTDIPAPTGDPDAPLKALIFDSIYDSYKGVIVYICLLYTSPSPRDTR